MVQFEEIEKVMAALGFPKEAVRCFTELNDKIFRDDAFRKEYENLLSEYWKCKKYELSMMAPELNKMADRYNVNQYSLHMFFVLSCSVYLHKLYEQQNIEEKIYWTSMDDIRCKLLECMECKGVPGTFVLDWFDGWFRMNRFGLGRFQYAESYFDGEPLQLPDGQILKNGDLLFAVHIPSSGVPLTEEVRNESYREAYEFLSRRFGTDTIIITCGSWMLYGKHREFLPKNSNILGFMDDFYLVSSTEGEVFKDDWRIFGRYAKLPIEQWPEDTSLRRAYKKWLLDGNQAGGGKGYAVLKKGINITKNK